MTNPKFAFKKPQDCTAADLHPEASLPPLCRIQHILTVVPIGRSTIWLWARQGRFPKPIKYGAITLWKRDDVLAWIQQASKDIVP